MRFLAVGLVFAASIAGVVWAAGAFEDDEDMGRCEIPAHATASPARAPGCEPIPDGAAATWVVLTEREARPENATANRRRPTAAELRRFRAENDFVPNSYAALVTGDYRGTTDDIIEWAAWKWGIAEDLLRAQAQHESDWRMDARGDEGESIGIMQIKRTVHRGTFPLSARSTAFNLDYYGSVFRYYFDGRAEWLGTEEHGRPYEAGDPWGSIGAHYAGRWYAAGAESYIADVRRLLAERRWGL